MNWRRGSVVQSILRLVGICAVVAGCSAPSPLALEEARKLSVELGGQAFTPPPRSTSDVVALLESEKPDAARLAELRAAADAVPPTTLKGAALAKFLFDRAPARNQLGDVAEAIGDLTAAVKEAEASGTDAFSLRTELAVTESLAGRYGEARRLREAQLALLSRSDNRRFHILSGLSYLFAAAGELERARQTSREAASLYDQLPPRMDPRALDGYLTAVRFAQGAVFEYAGQLGDAEKAYRQGVEAAVRAGDFIGPRATVAYRAKLAEMIARQGRFAEAEAKARKALLASLQRFGRHSPETARRSVLGLSSGALAQPSRGHHPGPEHQVFRLVARVAAVIRRAASICRIRRSDLQQGPGERRLCRGC
jgi:hypothetical protein